MQFMQDLLREHRLKFPKINSKWFHDEKLPLPPDVQVACQPFVVKKLKRPSQVLRTIQKDGSLLSCLQLVFIFDHHFSYPETQRDTAGLCTVYQFIRKNFLWQDRTLFLQFLTQGFGLLHNACHTNLLFCSETKTKETDNKWNVCLVKKPLSKNEILQHLRANKIPISFMTELQSADGLVMPPALFALHDIRHAVDYLFGHTFVIAKIPLPIEILTDLSEYLARIRDLWTEIWHKLFASCPGPFVDELFYLVHELWQAPSITILDLVLYGETDKKLSYLEKKCVTVEFMMWAHKEVQSYQKCKGQYLKVCNPKAVIDLQCCLPGPLEYMLSGNASTLYVEYINFLLKDCMESIFYYLPMNHQDWTSMKMICVDDQDEKANRLPSRLLPSFDVLNWLCDLVSVIVLSFHKGNVLQMDLITWNRRDLYKDMSVKRLHKSLLVSKYSDEEERIRCGFEHAFTKHPSKFNIGGVRKTASNVLWILHTTHYTLQDFNMLADLVQVPHFTISDSGASIPPESLFDDSTLHLWYWWLGAFFD